MAERSEKTMEEEEKARQSQEPEPRSTAVVENIQPLSETRDLKRTAENTQADTPASKRVCVADVQQSLSQHYTEGSGNLLINHPSQSTINILQLKPGTIEDILPALEKLKASSKPQPTLDSAVKPTDGDGSRQGAHATKDPGQVAAAESCRKALRIHYTTTGSYVKLIPWEDDDTKHIEDIYTKLTLEESRKKLESYKEIFEQTTRKGYPINRVILNGLPGRGKSTLMDKMAYDWACDEALQQFELVFVLRMSAVEQSTELIDSIFAQLLAEDTDVDEGALRSFMSHNEEKVLILLDGFDELKTHALDKTVFGSILKILNRKKGRDCYVVVTTRPSHYNKLVTSSLVQDPFTQVRVQGFEEEDIKEYIERFYLKEHGKAKGLLQRIKSSNVLSDLAKSPMLLLLMCILWRDNSTLPETMSRIYSEALEYIFRRKDMSPDEISNVTNELGKIGLRGLLAPEQMLAFPEEMFELSVLESAIKTGILTRQRVLKGMKSHNSIQFLHKTFQEYCAGKYLQSLLETDPVEFKKTLNEMINPARDFQYLLRFCAGDNIACTGTILQTLVESNEHKSDRFYYKYKSFMQLGLNCYFECQSKDLPPVEFIEFVLSDFVGIDDWNLFKYFLQNVDTHAKENKETDYLATVQSVEVNYCDLSGCMSDWAYCMSLMVNLSSVTLCNYSLTANSKEDATLLSGATSYASWADYFKMMKNLQKLEFSYCSLTGEDMKDIAPALCDLPNLVELNLVLNEALGGSAASWADHFKKLKNLQKLLSRDCSLTGEDMTHIAPTLCDLPNLVELSLRGNEALGGSAATWAYHFKKMKNLQKLLLSYCLLTGEDMTHIAHALSDLPNLVELDLTGNRFLGGSAASWAHHFKKMKNLQKLHLYFCSLTGEDMTHIAPALCDLPNLVELNLWGNEALGGSAASWAHHFKKMKNLQKVDLSDCSLTDEDMTHIAPALCDLTNLVKLNLQGNRALGGSAASWDNHFKKMKKLFLCY